jgi:hypothetical protein
MLTLIRAFSQTLPDGRILEMSLHRSESFLYIASLTADPRREDGRWIGELGLCYKPMLAQLLKRLEECLYRDRDGLIKVEAPIAFGAYVERDGRNGIMHAELCTDYETATIMIGGRDNKIPIFMKDLEDAYKWAA